MHDELRKLRDAAYQLAWEGNPLAGRAARDTLLQGESFSIEVLLDQVAAFPRADVVEEATWIAAQLANEDPAFRVLRDTLNDPRRPPTARAMAARALGDATLGSSYAEWAVEALGHLLDDSSSEVRDAAVAALEELGGPRAKRSLRAALEREQVEFIRQAIEDALDSWQDSG